MERLTRVKNRTDPVNSHQLPVSSIMGMKFKLYKQLGGLRNKLGGFQGVFGDQTEPTFIGEKLRGLI
ncbi:unnamed protein product [Prunus armeniaca]|uniref:Uncharacterized protein n=1 Tax=Prunus armeniaca TaxID=36596 RepID=A0A6J5XVC2_PRUAR|nr:unnamed protein product [Prunus armeniaca]CAB4314944.1 unnamed protein product [Prunus armeniaca]